MIVYLSRRNLLTLLSKLDRQLAGEDTACTLFKPVSSNDKYPHDAFTVVAVEDHDYYSDREPGDVHPADDPRYRR